MKKFLLIISFTFFLVNLHAQSKLEGMKQALKNELDLIKKLDLLIALSEMLTYSNPADALPYVNDALELADQLENKQAEAKAREYLGFIYWNQGQYEDAIDAFSKMLNLADKLKDKRMRARGLNDIGLIYEKMQNYDKALVYFRNALRLAEEKKDEALTIKLITNTGVVYQEKKHYGEALIYLKDALERSKKKAAYKEYTAFAMGAISRVYANMKEYEKALSYLEPAYTYLIELNNTLGQAYACQDFGMIYRGLEQYDKSLEYLKKGLQLSLKNKAKKETAVFYESLSLTYEAIDSLNRALECNRLFIKYNDSVFNEKNAQKVARLQAQFEIQKKEKEIQQLQAYKAKKEASSKQQNRLSVVFIALFVLVLALAFFLFYSNRQKNLANKMLVHQNEAIIHQKEEINSQNEQLQELDKEKNSMIRIVAHDLKAPLNRVLGLSELINLEEENLSEAQKKYLNLIRRVASDGTALIQNLLDFRAIEEESLKVDWAELNIEELISDLLAGYKEPAEKKGIHIEFIKNTEELFIVSDSSFLSRIFDNLISNAIKFSPLNKNVYIKVNENHRYLKVSIQDEGVGISKEDFGKLFRKFQKLSARPTAGESSTGLGLSIVKTLLDKIQGDIQVESVVGEGTTFTVELPKKLDNVQILSPQDYSDR